MHTLTQELYHALSAFAIKYCCFCHKTALLASPVYLLAQKTSVSGWAPHRLCRLPAVFDIYTILYYTIQKLKETGTSPWYASSTPWCSICTSFGSSVPPSPIFTRNTKFSSTSSNKCHASSNNQSQTVSVLRSQTVSSLLDHLLQQLLPMPLRAERLFAQGPALGLLLRQQQPQPAAVSKQQRSQRSESSTLVPSLALSEASLPEAATSKVHQLMSSH